MRIIVILTPTNKYGTKMAYTALRKFLISDGYERIAPEVFMRITTGRKGNEKHLRRLSDFSPGTGTVRILTLTEKQYNNIIYLTGEPDEQEKTRKNLLKYCELDTLAMVKILEKFNDVIK